MLVRALAVAAAVLVVGCTSPPRATEPTPGNRQYVVLLHGLARDSGSMATLQERLAEAGYGTCNIDYPSTDHAIEVLAGSHVRPAMAECLPEAARAVHYVTHSLGGIIVRYLLDRGVPHPTGRVVMLAPPNQGSMLAERLRDFWPYQWLNGPAGQQLGIHGDSLPRALGPVDFELGVIAGQASLNPILSLLIPGEDDGKLAVIEAAVAGMDDFRIVDASHTFIMEDGKAIGETLHFLRHGRFRAAEPER